MSRPTKRSKRLLRSSYTHHTVHNEHISRDILLTYPHQQCHKQHIHFSHFIRSTYAQCMNSPPLYPVQFYSSWSQFLSNMCITPLVVEVVVENVSYTAQAHHWHHGDLCELLLRRVEAFAKNAIVRKDTKFGHGTGQGTDFVV
jgi:hypothetical protein